MEKQIELAKSWFVAAQLFMILAGFLIASAGIILTNAQNTMHFGLNKAEQITKTDCSTLDNITEYQNLMVGTLDYVGETVESSIEVYMILWKYGAALIIFSVFLFIIGQQKLRKI